MEAKKLYDAPSTAVVELRTEGIVCQSNSYVIWLLSGSSNEVISSDTEWTRGGYGSANEL